MLVAEDAFEPANVLCLVILKDACENKGLSKRFSNLCLMKWD